MQKTFEETNELRARLVDSFVHFESVLIVSHLLLNFLGEHIQIKDLIDNIGSFVSSIAK